MHSLPGFDQEARRPRAGVPGEPGDRVVPDARRRTFSFEEFVQTFASPWIVDLRQEQRPLSGIQKPGRCDPVDELWQILSVADPRSEKLATRSLQRKLTGGKMLCNVLPDVVFQFRNVERNQQVDGTLWIMLRGEMPRKGGAPCGARVGGDDLGELSPAVASGRVLSGVEVNQSIEDLGRLHMLESRQQRLAAGATGGGVPRLGTVTP